MATSTFGVVVSRPFWPVVEESMRRARTPVLSDPGPMLADCLTTSDPDGLLRLVGVFVFRAALQEGADVMR